MLKLLWRGSHLMPLRSATQCSQELCLVLPCGICFNAVTQPAASLGGTPSVFAEDLNVFKRFDRQTSSSDIERNMHLCRVRYITGAK